MNPWKRISRRVKAEYRDRIVSAWKAHGIDVHETREIKGIRALIHAIYETPLGYTTFPREDLEAIARAAEQDEDFAKTLRQIAAKYGAKIPFDKSPESYVELVAEQPRWTITLSQQLVKRRTGTKLGDLKLEMLRDIEELTKRAYEVVKK